MDIVFPKNFKVIDMIRHGARTGVSVAELQYVGLSTTVINQLENHDIIYLSDVLKLKDDFQKVRKMSSKIILGINKALRNYHKLEAEMKRSQQTTPRLEFYKKHAEAKMKQALI